MRAFVHGRNVTLLFVVQAVHSTALAIVIATAPLISFMLLEDKSLATLPHAVQWVATMAMTIPASFFMKWVGRKIGFMVGACGSVIAGFLAIWAIFEGSFFLFCLATVFTGATNGFAVFYRFAAAEATEPQLRSRAISFVLAGGVVAAVAGPALATWTKDLLLPYVFAGAWLAVSLLSLAVLGVLSFTTLKRPTTIERRTGGRPLGVIVRQPAYLTALVGGMFSWGVMVLMMASTPLAMLACRHNFADTAFVIQWHLVGMFGPSLFSGWLVTRFGISNIMLAGVVLLFGAASVALSGLEVVHFWAANFLVGMGWNFLFLGATTLLTTTYTAPERAKAQGLNDFLVYGSAAVCSLASGIVHNFLGWSAVIFAIFPVVAVVGLMLLWLRLRPRPMLAQ